MRLHRFFLNTPIGEGKEITISDKDLLHQWRRVFRFQVGTEVIIFDGSGAEFRAVITLLSGYEAQLTILEKRDIPRPSIEVFLFSALVKKDTFEWIAEKATELGVSHIVPVLSARSEKKNLNEERLQKIIMEASEQCGRGDVPILHPIISVAEVFESFPKPIIAFDPNGEPFVKQKIVSPSSGEEKSRQKIGIMIGPEGGWTDDELELFQHNGVKIYSIGKNILRAETAAVAALVRVLL